MASNRALISTIVVLAVAALVAVVRQRDRGGEAPSATGRATETVEHCLERMLDAARAGDVRAYLGCFEGELRDRLQAGVAAQRPERAAAELRSGEADLKSFATHALERSGTDEAVVMLERIYSRRHDLQRVRLRRSGGEWKIVELVPVERVAPVIPYGTPVVPEAGDARSDE